MEFNIDKIQNKKRGRAPKVTDEEIKTALESGLFTSQAAIARYFGISPQALGQRIKKIKLEGGLQNE